MKLIKKDLLGQIDAYYRRRAQETVDASEAFVAAWDAWNSEQMAKVPKLHAASVELVREVEEASSRGVLLDSSDVKDRFDELTLTFPSWRSPRVAIMKGAGVETWPRERPQTPTFEEVYDRFCKAGRFAPLQRALAVVEEGTVALSSLQKLGVLGVDDARILWREAGVL